MMKKRKYVCRFFLAWQDRAEEKWLSEMAMNGWMLKKLFLFVYLFEKTEPNETVYRLDYKATSNRDEEEYIRIFQDAGWRHVTRLFNWHYFAADASQVQTTAIYTDRESEALKYKGLLRVLYTVFIGVCLSLFLPLLYVGVHGYLYGLYGFGLIAIALLIACILKVRSKTKID